MNVADFAKWVDYHDAMFPGFSSWFGTNVASNPDARQAWQDGLSLPNLDACKEASRGLLHGDITAEGGYTSHLRAIRARAQEIQSTRTSSRMGRSTPNGEDLFNCPHCLDAGTVRIWRPEVMADALAGKTPEPKTCEAACSCGIMPWVIEGGQNGLPITARVKHTVGEWAKVRLPVYEEGGIYCFRDVKTRRVRTSCIAKATGWTMAEKLESISSAASAFDTVEDRPNYNQQLAEFNE